VKSGMIAKNKSGKAGMEGARLTTEGAGGGLAGGQAGVDDTLLVDQEHSGIGVADGVSHAVVVGRDDEGVSVCPTVGRQRLEAAVFAVVAADALVATYV
jgi:hypothetical protein